MSWGTGKCRFTDEMDKVDNVRGEFNLRAPLVGEVALREAASSEGFLTELIRRS